MSGEDDGSWKNTPPREAQLKRVWKTRHARFNAYRRLLDTQRWVTWSIAILSTYIIIGAVLPYLGVLRLSDQERILFSLGVAAASLFILVVSLIQKNREYRLQAHRLHECAIELTKLYTELEAFVRGERKDDEEDDGLTYERLREKYGRILADYSDVNHRPVDLLRLKADKPSEFGIGRVKAFFLRRAVQVRVVGVYVFAVSLPPLVLLWWFFPIQ